LSTGVESIGAIAVAYGVEAESLVPAGGVVGACAVVEGGDPDSSVIRTCAVVLERFMSGCSVGAARGVGEECGLSVSRIVETNGIGEEGVVRAGGIEGAGSVVEEGVGLGLAGGKDWIRTTRNKKSIFESEILVNSLTPEPRSLA
jgi:hypothetical protein